jgi:alanine-synthesizing transaminase
MKTIQKSAKLANVCYDIRGPVMARARALEEEGHRIIKLNIGNLAPFGFEAPEEVVRDVVINLPGASGYSDSRGLFAARKAIMQYAQTKSIAGVQLDDIITGNGVSELIVMSMQALLDAGDEVLVPAPDYPLWTAAVSLAGGTPRHYLCDEASGWLPALDDLERTVSERTKALVDFARRHGLIIFADEIYDKMIYDGLSHTSIASLADDLLFITFNGLSKNYRACGYRAGWMIISGNKRVASDYIEGLNMLATMRLCANVPAQFAIQTALGGRQSINDLINPGGRLYRQRELAWSLLTQIPGVSCVKPQAALYLFPKLDRRMYPITDDQQFILELLEEQHVLVVQGTGFNWPDPDHLRIVFLPNADDLHDAVGRFGRFLDGYRRRHA